MDTESTSLTAIMGRLLCASFVTLDGEPYTFRADQKPWKARDPIDDSKLAIAIRDELERFHLICGWNSKLHDVPLLNSRLGKYGHRPYHCQNFHLDPMYHSRGSSNKIGSSKLDNVAKFYGVAHEKTELKWEVWQRAAAGDKASMDQVVEHCEADVKVLRDVYWHLLPSVKSLHR